MHEGDPIIRSGRQPTRTEFSTRAQDATWIHLATYGFFLGSSTEAKASPIDPWARSDPGSVVTQLAPMALCGMVLAGANEGSAEGILTAEEIAGLDLSHCELAVLSACDTNVGVQNGQRGIQSLQAALHAAGVRTSITSLWKVDDRATRELMLAFYRLVWVDGLSKAHALWQAKKSLREQGAPVGIWGAWVLTGSPR